MKRLLHSKIGAKWYYNFDLLCIGIFIIPLIPNQLLQYINLFELPRGMESLQKAMNSKVNDIYSGMSNIGAERSWIRDYSLSVNRTLSGNIFFAILTIWLIGIIVLTSITILNYLNIKVLKNSITEINNVEMLALYTDCKERTGVKKSIILGESPLIQSPMVMGFFRVYIVLPSKVINRLSKQEIGHILLHELFHVKNKDILISYSMCLLRILIWFNPCVYILLKEMKNDREIACDASVLEVLEESSCIEYGKTIINFAEAISNSFPFYITTNMGGNLKQIKRRIEKLADYSEETVKSRRFGKIIFLITSILILVQAPMSTITFASDKYDFHVANVEYEDLSDYFNGMNGCFVLYDLQADQYSIYNKERSITRLSPDSTYKIYGALFALENGIINKDGIQDWDTTVYPYKEWNQTQTLTSAMKYSVSWYFWNLDQVAGLRKLEDYYEEINYGNADLSGGIKDYWLESSLLISPVEQVELLKNFYSNDLIFQQDNIDIIKDTIKINEADGFILSGKTGTGTVRNKDVNGWFIGYIEKGEDTFIFATNICGEDNANGSVATSITLSILKDKKLFQTY
jgi:bla regulator protein BlaR1